MKLPIRLSQAKYPFDKLTMMKKQETKKKVYQKPAVNKVTIDNEISMVMMSFGPGFDPEGSIIKKLNPLRWWK